MNIIDQKIKILLQRSTTATIISFNYGDPLQLDDHETYIVQYIFSRNRHKYVAYTAFKVSITDNLIQQVQPNWLKTNVERIEPNKPIASIDGF